MDVVPHLGAPTTNKFGFFILYLLTLFALMNFNNFPNNLSMLRGCLKNFEESDFMPIALA
jgi:hypothetical protein